jgi:choline dehydrogenase-like flavoprotein
MSQYDADVIVIGAGILGGAVANALAKQKHSVILLEAGSEFSREELLKRFRGSPNKSNLDGFYPDQAWASKGSDPHYIESVGSQEQRPSYLRLMGGTSWHWGSALWRLLPNDFKLKSTYGHGRDWPVDYDELEPWYQLAESEIGVSGSDTDDQSGRGGQQPFPSRSKPYPMSMQPWSYQTQQVANVLTPLGHHVVDEPNGRATRDYNGRPACQGNNNCAPLCPIGAQFTGEMPVKWARDHGAKLITNAVVYKLEKSLDRKKITAVHYYTPEGKSQRLSARFIVLAANGLETPKLLLMSDVANSSDMVGRNLMGHNAKSLFVFTRDPVWSGRGPTQQGSINTWRDGEWRKQHGAVRHFMFNSSPVEMVTKMLLAQGVYGKTLDDRIKHDSSRLLRFSTYTEFLPDPSNRVLLSTQKDALGLPKPKTDYHLTAYGLASEALIFKDYDNFRKAFAVTKELSDPKVWSGSSHIMGTVIMGNDPKDSVVDKHCRSHDHDNLFIASTGVHPSSAVVNPTLTTYALSLRIADIIHQSL